MFSMVVVGTDGSTRAGLAVREAIDVAKSQGARLHLVAAYSTSQPHWEGIQGSARVDPVDLRQVAESVLSRAAREAADEGVEADFTAREGEPAEAIIDVALECKADLIVVGSKGMSGARRFSPGSVPDKVSHRAPCSVMVVRTE